MKFDDECYGAIIDLNKTSWIRVIIMHHNLKKNGFIKDDPKFMKIYGLKSGDNYEVWSRPIKKRGKE